MQIGRRIFYDTTTGAVLKDSGDMQGDVTTPEMSGFPELAGRTTANTGWVDCTFGDAQFNGGVYGSLHVDPTTKAVTVYPRAGESVNKNSIKADGLDTATVTVTYPTGYTADTGVTSFSVNGGTPVNVAPSNGVCTFNLTASVAGTYQIAATTPKYGTLQTAVTAS